MVAPTSVDPDALCSWVTRTRGDVPPALVVSRTSFSRFLPSLKPSGSRSRVIASACLVSCKDGKHGWSLLASSCVPGPLVSSLSSIVLHGPPADAERSSLPRVPRWRPTRHRPVPRKHGSSEVVVRALSPLRYLGRATDASSASCAPVARPEGRKVANGEADCAFVFCGVGQWSRDGTCRTRSTS